MNVYLFSFNSKKIISDLNKNFVALKDSEEILMWG